MNNLCNICSNTMFSIFQGQVLNKYIINYYKCSNCNIIQTDKPYWLEESYSNTITLLDLGLLSRCILNVSRTESIINKILSIFIDKYKISILDFAGGYGVYTRLMRDKGFYCYWQDDFCENIFAKDFIHKEHVKYDLVTAFEVFEHEQDPNLLFQRLTLLSDNILLSTLILPRTPLKDTNDWWYFTPETGQHITFYTLKSLDLLANKYGFYFYTNGNDLHFITKTKLKFNPFLEKNFFLKSHINRFINYFNKILNTPKNIIIRKSLLDWDYNFVKNKINDKK